MFPSNGRSIYLADSDSPGKWSAPPLLERYRNQQMLTLSVTVMQIWIHFLSCQCLTTGPISITNQLAGASHRAEKVKRRVTCRRVHRGRRGVEPGAHRHKVESTFLLGWKGLRVGCLFCHLRSEGWTWRLHSCDSASAALTSGQGSWPWLLSQALFVESLAGWLKNTQK